MRNFNVKPARDLFFEPTHKRGVFYRPCSSCPLEMGDLCPHFSHTWDQAFYTSLQVYQMGRKVRQARMVGRLPGILERLRRKIRGE